MATTIQAGDSLIADMHWYRHHQFQRGDILLLKRPHEPGVIVIKRLIALDGDTIRGINGRIERNGKPLDEPYIQQVSDVNGLPGWVLDFGPITIPPHKLFVIGDNRGLSLDSRSPDFGMVDDSAVLGKALYIFGDKHKQDRTGQSLH